MRIINKKYLLIILLVGIILTGVIILKPKEKIKLDNVILKQEVNNKTFAMYKEDNENKYVPVEDNKFPEGYALNVTESNCIDNNGNEIKDALSYENGEVTIMSGKTIYCYLYFDKTLGVEIKEKEPKGLKTDAIRGAMYRFQGQAKDENNTELVNNYICFGTSDLKECTTNQDKYMYRIIGIEAKTGRVKVIKKEALENTYQWHTDYDTDVKLPESIFFKAINGEDFLENPIYIPTGWKEKIADNTWTYGDMWSNDDAGAKQLGAGLYDTESGKKSTSWDVKSTLDDGGVEYEVQWPENTEYYKHKLYYKVQHGNWTDTIDSKVSLMYLNDYSYSVGDEAKCNRYHTSEDIAKCKLGWINLSNNDSSAPSEHEWTMSRLGWWHWSGAFLGFVIVDSGYIGDWHLASNLLVRPVFYIDASQTLKDGIGTIDDPFIIN